MTAVEWFAIQLYEQGYFDGSTPKSITNLDHLQEQAKQMEKEQIINAFDEGQEYEYQVFVNSAPRFFSDTYYNETYGSKGSDDHIVYTNEMVSSKTEISDEEIEDRAAEWMEEDWDVKTYYEAFIDGASWYKEQLKSRQ
jgi:hypothetical protein